MGDIWATFGSNWNVRWLARQWNLRHTIPQKVADNGYTKKFVERSVAEVGGKSSAVI